METVAKVPARLKAAENEPRVRVLCGLRIARFVEHPHVRPTPVSAHGGSLISDDGGSLASAILYPPSIGARNDPSEIKLSAAARDSNCRA